MFYDLVTHLALAGGPRILPSDVRKVMVWAKGTQILGWDPNCWRSDCYGNMISFAEYGNRQSEHGWEIDHIVPESLGGSDALSNLRPLQWRANARRQPLNFGQMIGMLERMIQARTAEAERKSALAAMRLPSPMRIDW